MRVRDPPVVCSHREVEITVRFVQQQGLEIGRILLGKVVGASGFEPPTLGPEPTHDVLIEGPITGCGLRSRRRAYHRPTGSRTDQRVFGHQRAVSFPAIDKRCNSVAPSSYECTAPREYESEARRGAPTDHRTCGTALATSGAVYAAKMNGCASRNLATESRLKPSSLKRLRSIAICPFSGS